MEQAELANDIGVSRNTITNYEQMRTNPRRPVVLAWAVRTGVPIEWLWDGKDNIYQAPLSERMAFAGRSGVAL